MVIRSPWSDLIFLLLLTFVSMIIIQGAGLVSTMLTTTPNYNTYILFITGTIGTFIIPALLYSYFRKYTDVFLVKNVREWSYYLLGAVLLFALGPIMNLLSSYNQKLVLPDFLDGLEEWMRVQEDLMAEITAKTIMVDRFDLLFLNLVVTAILPAIGEELFFRGALQHIFLRIVKNEIIAIWIVGVIFSAIHFQFYGFLPRLFLGVAFGYLFFWTKNIWVPIFAHFVNNATVTIYAFYSARQGKTYEEFMTVSSYPIIVYIGSLIFSGLIVVLFHNYSKFKETHGNKLG